MCNARHRTRVADADQVAAAHHEPPVGLLNPMLCSLGRRHGDRVLRDVTQGGSDLGTLIDKSPLGCCSAHVGYDGASGLGSVNVAALARSADRRTGARSLQTVQNRCRTHPADGRGSPTVSLSLWTAGAPRSVVALGFGVKRSEDA
jgi:hypothetical protein